ncbi:rhamnulokinase [Mordavella massiliensis]|uniref:rhamnulokinase n=1 Tax=Mordavella massiliensis TaxID=1871024 RepID=UPI002109CBF5|nr:rhamnulokinase [Mordavella massiliensis]
MGDYYLAVDIGASSGRHILGSLQGGKLVLEEIYRFENGMVKRNGHLCWDYEKLFGHIKAGIRKCAQIGKIPKSMGIDTWGVDYVLLDDRDEIIGETYGYRDRRTDGIDEEVAGIIGERELYQRTGIEKMTFNTLYQLMALKKEHPEELEQAKALLFVPDYFHFLLTGKKVNEYTEASTSQLMNAAGKCWDEDLLARLELPGGIFQRIAMPGESLGKIRKELAEEFGFDMEVVLPCTHDTASAILAIPADGEDYVFISSGTWSLLGIERDEPDCSEVSRQNHFTNEGGFDSRICYHRNIMGLWMIQSVRHELGDSCSFEQICEEAEKEKEFSSRVDVTDQSFMAPDNMTEAIKDYCKKTGQQVPKTLGEIASCIYASLAKCYADTIRGIEVSTGRTYTRIHIVGGGGKAGYLNKLTAEATGKEVHAGPTEGTALGNITAQMIRSGEFTDKTEARNVIYRSFDIKVYR